jgi:hypothetical protein
VVVVGDLVLDVALSPDRPIERGTDVPGRIRVRQGGSAATTTRWLGRLGARATLVCAIGRDGPGRALTAAVERDGVTVRAVRVAGTPTGRIGVLVEPEGQRSFVTDRGAALRLRPEDVAGRFAGADAVHLGLLAARPAARPGGHGGDPARPRGRRPGHGRPGVQRPLLAHGDGTPSRCSARRPRPAVRDPRRGAGAGGSEARGAAAGAGAVAVVKRGRKA